MWKEASSSIRPVVAMQYRLVTVGQTDGQTDRQTALLVTTAYTALA